METLRSSLLSFILFQSGTSFSISAYSTRTPPSEWHWCAWLLVSWSRNFTHFPAEFIQPVGHVPVSQKFLNSSEYARPGEIEISKEQIKMQNCIFILFVTFFKIS